MHVQKWRTHDSVHMKPKNKQNLICGVRNQYSGHLYGVITPGTLRSLLGCWKYSIFEPSSGHMGVCIYIKIHQALLLRFEHFNVTKINSTSIFLNAKSRT